MNFKNSKIRFKERQLLYEEIKEVDKIKEGIIEYKGIRYEKTLEEFAYYVFVWSNHRIILTEYNSKNNSFTVGEKIFYVKSKKERKKILIYLTKLN